MVTCVIVQDRKKYYKKYYSTFLDRISTFVKKKFRKKIVHDLNASKKNDGINFLNVLFLRKFSLWK